MINNTLKSTHLIDLGPGYGLQQSVVCGNYCRRLTHSLFGGAIKLSSWSRIPVGAELIPYIDTIIEREGCGILNTSDNQ